MKKGRVIWLTGLPCSGKTTISYELEKYFQGVNVQVQRLDGDVVRETISKDLGFSKEDRDRNIERMTYVAQLLAENGVTVISAFVSPYRSMRDFARETIGDGFVEVFVDAQIATCKDRDVKGMYAKAEAGEIEGFTGVQDPYEMPENPDFTVDTTKESLEESTQNIIYFIENKT